MARTSLFRQPASPPASQPARIRQSNNHESQCPIPVLRMMPRIPEGNPTCSKRFARQKTRSISRDTNRTRPITVRSADDWQKVKVEYWVPSRTPTSCGSLQRRFRKSKKEEERKQVAITAEQEPQALTRKKSEQRHTGASNKTLATEDEEAAYNNTFILNLNCLKSNLHVIVQLQVK
ncbi:hypothetical protein DPMN_001167 [Dreissena polymorpha]|uniref:Uncharacterized protein n=1 Tax=Dreissena polymorpha TaxID=45954 RepID=A0A9D4RQM3_DREPO|nr:hypothetical protein DPMN_001167 [Dreissena polymorpha]